LVAGIRIQILLKGNLKATPLRSIENTHESAVEMPGIVVATAPSNHAIQLTVRCGRCNDTMKLLYGGTLRQFSLAANCHGADSNECGRYPYTVVPDESRLWISKR
jgi:hypothetical protein